MAELARIQFKRTDEKGKKPTADILESGELAINLKDQYLFTKDSTGNVINLSTPPVYEGDVSFTGTVKGQKAILGKTADYSSYVAHRDLSKFGAFRTNQMDGFDALILNVPHPSASLNNYAHGRGFEFQYGHVGNKVYTYGFNANGEKAFKFRMYHEGDKPSPSELNVYSRQDIDQRVSVSAGETKLRAPNQTNLLIAKDNKELIWYDGTTNTRMVNFGAGGLDLGHKLSDNVGISLYKKDGYRVKVETHTHSSSNMLAFSYKDSAGNNTHVINMPKANGLLATQEWVDSKYYKRNDSPTFNDVTGSGTIRGGAFLTSRGNESLKIGFNPAGSGTQNPFISYYNGSNWYPLYHPQQSGMIATREWSTSNLVRIGTGGNTALHNYNTGGHGYSSWNEKGVRQAYIGFPADGSKEFAISNEKGSSGTINLKAGNVLVNGVTIASQNWCNSNFLPKVRKGMQKFVWANNGEKPIDFGRNCSGKLCVIEFNDGGTMVKTLPFVIPNDSMTGLHAICGGAGEIRFNISPTRIERVQTWHRSVVAVYVEQ